MVTSCHTMGFRGLLQAIKDGTLECVTSRVCHIYIRFELLLLFICSVVSDSLRLCGLQASLSITNSQSLLKLMSIKSVMPSNHLILSSPSPPALNLSQNQGHF